MSSICDKIGKRRRKASRSRSRGLERTPTTLPICHHGLQYPPGCTVLECRFEADRPVARIVHVPADTAATARNSCLLVEMRPSSDSFSRVTSRRKDIKQRVGSTCSQKRMTDKFLRPASYILKSRDCTDDSVALPGKVPVKIVSSVILKIDKSEKQLGDSSSKILHLAERAIPDQKARVSSGRAFSERSIRRKSKPEVTHRSPPDCELACPGRDLKINISLFPEMKDPLSQVTRKDGLDPSEIPCSLKKPSRRYKRRICPASCCQPVRRSVTKDVCSDFLHTKSSAPDAKSPPIEVWMTQIRLDDQRRLQRLASEQMLRTEVTRTKSAKSDKASACQRSAAAFRRASLIPERIPGDISRLPSSQKLLARYKEFIPAYQLERYETCRSKRNGLQDECIPPLLRAILKKEEQQRTLAKCIKRERNVDQLGQSGTSESGSQTKFLLYME